MVIDINQDDLPQFVPISDSWFEPITGNSVSAFSLQTPNSEWIMKYLVAGSISESGYQIGQVLGGTTISTSSNGLIFEAIPDEGALIDAKIYVLGCFEPQYRFITHWFLTADVSSYSCSDYTLSAVSDDTISITEVPLSGANVTQTTIKDLFSS